MPTPQKTLLEKTISGVSWMLLGAFGQGFFHFIVFVILARILSPADFGVIAAGQSLILVMMIFSQFGLGYALVQRAEISAAHIHSSFACTILSGILCGALFFLCAPSIAQFYSIPSMTPYLRLMSLSFPFYGSFVVAEALARRALQFSTLAKVTILSYFISYGVVGVLLALNGFGAWSLAWAFLTQHCSQAILLIALTPQRFNVEFDKKSLRELLHLGGHFTTSEGFFALAIQIDKIIIGKILGETALGLYGRAFRIMVLPSAFFGRVIDQVLVPIVAQSQNKIETVRSVYLRGIGVVAFFMLPLSLFVFYLCPIAIAFVLGEKWMGMIEPLRYLLPGMVFRTAFNVSDSFAKSLGLVRQRFWGTVVHLIAIATGTIFGIHLGGLNGAAIGVATASFINFLATSHFVRISVKVTWIDILRKFRDPLLLFAILSAETLLLHFGLPAEANFELSKTAIIILIWSFTLLVVNFNIWESEDLSWIREISVNTVKKKISRYAAADTSSAHLGD